MASGKNIKSTNPFDSNFADDVDDETFLKNSRKYQQEHNNLDKGEFNSEYNLNAQIGSFQDRKRQIEERTIQSTQQSLNILRDSEQIGIATAEELMRQREKLEKTDRQLDEINNTLRFSQKHINGIKSVFSSLKNYVSGKSSKSSTTPVHGAATSSPESTSHVETNSPFAEHPTRRLRNDNNSNSYQAEQHFSGESGSKDFSAKLDANLQEMCDNVLRLKGLASELGQEIDEHNDIIDDITNKVDKADLTIQGQNKDMTKLLQK